ncbi:MAG: endonuclease/exonuclease/phosphatase family protein [Planctomycetota bacterium]
MQPFRFGRRGNASGSSQEMDDASAWAHLSRRLASTLSIIAVLSVAFVVGGWFGRSHFALDLASHFRVQAVASTLACGLVLLALRRFRRGMLALAASVLIATSLWPYLPATRSKSASAGQTRLLLANVRSSNKQYHLLLDEIASFEPEIIVLLEVNGRWAEVMSSGLPSSYRHQTVQPREDNFGIAIYSRLEWLTCTVTHLGGKDFPPSLEAVFSDDGATQQRLIAMHPVPPIGRQNWQHRNSAMSAAARRVASQPPDRTILIGDLNCTPWSPQFQSLVEDSGLRDSAIGNGIHPTWYPFAATLGGLLGLPIDHALVGNDVVVRQRHVGPAIGSDHRPLILDFIW